MAEKHPYMSGSAGIVSAITQLRKSFPAQVTADTLKKLSIAPNNESLVINTLRFVGVLDAESKKTPAAAKIFSQADAEFQTGFSELVKAAYKGLFELHGTDAWTTSVEKLVAYFRSTDHTSAITGARQASTFQTLASLGGKGAAPASSGVKKVSSKPTGSRKPPKATVVVTPPHNSPPSSGKPRDVGLTVRIEVNLPAGADQETYDRIFKSMRENLLND